MGLFVNRDQPSLFMNKNIDHSNQKEYKINLLNEVMEEQRTLNRLFKQAIIEFSNTQQQLSRQQFRQWNAIQQQLKELKEIEGKHNVIETKMNTQYQQLDEQITKLHLIIKKEQENKDHLLDQILNINNYFEEIVYQIGKLKSDHEEIADQIREIKSNNGGIVHQIGELKSNNEEISYRIGELKSNNEEISHQIGDLKSNNEEISHQIGELKTDNGEIVHQIRELKSNHEEIAQQIRESKTNSEQMSQQLTLLNEKHKQNEEAQQQIETRVDEKLHEHHVAVGQIADQLSNMEKIQQDVLGRLEGQEGLNDKIVHQLDYLRFVLFERTHQLEEKIDNLAQTLPIVDEEEKTTKNNEGSIIE